MKMPLEGIRVVDWTIWQQGPLASSLLGDLGAEVIKVEDRISGDPGRGLSKLIKAAVGATAGNYYFDTMNRSKKGITLDLRKEKGKEILYRLVEKSDVFVQNFRRGVAEELGVDYATLSRCNPRLIYASGSGWGPKGPLSHESAYDAAAQARSGLMTIAGAGGLPLMRQGGIGDQMGGIMTAYGVLAALVARERLGVGQELDSSLLGSLLLLMGHNVAYKLMLGIEMPNHDRASNGNPLWNYYKCADGKWIMLGELQPDRVWPNVCKALGIQELEKDPRFENIFARGKNCEALISILDKVFAARTRDEWLQIFREYDFVYQVVNTISEVVDDPQVLANDYITEFDHPSHGKVKMLGTPVKFSKTPARITSWAPEHGQHTEEVLTEILGYTWDDIIKLKDEEVI